jgi:hypothetical protein
MTDIAKLTRITSFEKLKSDDSRSTYSSAKAQKLASEFESFVLSVRKEIEKKSKSSYGKKRR